MNRRKFIAGAASVLAAAAIPAVVTRPEVVIGIDGGGAEFSAVALVRYTAHREFQIQEICRIFSVPRHLIGEVRA